VGTFATGLVAALVLGGGVLLAAAGTSQAGPAAATFPERFSAAALGPDCSARSWPYLAPECLRMPDGSLAAPVRVIAIDRLASSGRVVTLAK